MVLQALQKPQGELQGTQNGPSSGGFRRCRDVSGVSGAKGLLVFMVDPLQPRKVGLDGRDAHERRVGEVTCRQP